MGSEAALRDMLRRKLSPFGRIARVENPLDPGFPDVLYCLRRPNGSAPATGLIELKQMDAWPRRAATPVVIDSLTREQVDWLADWERAGGRANLLLQIGRAYLLLDVPTVRLVFVRERTGADLAAGAVVVGRDGFPTAGILRYLTR